MLNARTISDFCISLAGSAPSVKPPDSSAATPPLPPDSASLCSGSKILATKASGSCGVDLGPVLLRIVTLSASPMGDWLYDVRKRRVLVGSLMFSTFAMLRFTAMAV